MLVIQFGYNFYDFKIISAGSNFFEWHIALLQRHYHKHMVDDREREYCLGIGKKRNRKPKRTIEQKRRQTSNSDKKKQTETPYMK